jgi:glucarate dehydratase
MQDDVLTERIPIADGPAWGRIEKPGLGVEVDETKLAHFHEAYRRDGQFLPYQTRQIARDP